MKEYDYYAVVGIFIPVPKQEKKKKD